MTLAQLRQAFLASVFRRGLSPATQASYRWHLERLERWLEQTGLDVGSFSQRLDDPSLPLAAKTRVVALAWLNWAYREGFLGRPPSSVRCLRRGVEALTVDQVQALLAIPDGPYPASKHGAPRDPRTAERDRALLETLYGTGIRLGEAVALDLADLNLDQAVLRVQGKGGRERLQPLGVHLREEVLPTYLETVRAAWAQPEEPALFVSFQGGRISRETLQGRIRLCARLAGLGTVGPHALRRAFATHLLDQGAPLEAVRDLLGHRDMQVLHRYLTVSAEALEREVDRFHPRRRRRGPR